MRRTLGDPDTLSEFITGLHGDCGPLATLSALTNKSARNWPLNRAGLIIVNDAEARHGFEERNGAQNIYDMSAALGYFGFPANRYEQANTHTLVGYGQVDLNKLHDVLHAYAGVCSILIEWANAQALPGDEPGVHFHFSNCTGIDSSVDVSSEHLIGTYLFCDGDNRADDQTGQQRPPVWYTWPDIMRAQPVAYIRLL
jgi:hypothetical protein